MSPPSMLFGDQEPVQPYLEDPEATAEFKMPGYYIDKSVLSLRWYEGEDDQKMQSSQQDPEPRLELQDLQVMFMTSATAGESIEELQTFTEDELFSTMFIYVSKKIFIRKYSEILKSGINIFRLGDLRKTATPFIAREPDTYEMIQ